MAPWDVYPNELSILSKGHAVLNPRRDPLRDGSGLRPAIDVGDVVYDLEGRLIRLFNCLRPREQQDADCVFPHDFEVLRIARSNNVFHSEPMEIEVKPHFYRPGPFFSKGVKMLKVEAGVSATSVGGARLSFSTRHEQGAVLLTSGRVMTRQSPNRPSFQRYMIQHFDSWCKLLESRELGVLPEDLMLITGLDATEAWSNLCFSESQLQGEFSVDIPSIVPVDIALSASMNFHHTHSLTRDSGPNPEDMETVAGSQSSPEAGQSPAPSDRQRVNQVIFVRALRGKRRRFLKGLKVVGSADPKGMSNGPPSSDDDDSSSRPLSVESVGDIQRRQDFLVPVLDFILENSDAEMAIVHDDDFRAYHKYMQEQHASSPSSDPSIIRCSVEDGVVIGTFNELGPEAVSASETPEPMMIDYMVELDGESHSGSESEDPDPDDQTVYSAVERSNWGTPSTAFNSDMGLHTDDMPKVDGQDLTLSEMIEMEHANGILLHLFKLGEVRRRTLAVAVRYNSMDATASEAFRDSVASCYREGDRRPMMPLFENAIAFRAAPDHSSGPGRFSHTYPSNSGKQWYILDVEAADLSRIVPLNVSVPYVGRAPGRAALLLDAIDPVPLWVVTNEGLGVPVTREGNEELYHAHRQVTTADGRARRTVSVKIEWPGYPLWEAQIRMKADESRVADSCTFMRLVRHVKGKVRKFILDHADVPCSDPHWAVGDVAQGRITANDLTLLAIVAVSQGAVMPILKLRDDFDFTTSNTVATDNYQDGYTPAAAGPMSVPKEQLDLDDNLVSDTEQLYHPNSLSDAGLSFYAGHWQYQGPFDDYHPYN